jgi:glycosyltransferase involved in cell wall biosynthesis
MTKKKIIFVLPSLKAGGAERVVSFLAKNFDQNVFEIKIVIVGYKKDAVYNVDDLDVTFFNQKRLFNAVYPLYKFIKKQKPYLVFGTIRHVNILLGIYNLIFKNVRFIVREASVMSTMSKFSNSKQQIPNFLLKFLYSKLDAIVCQSNDIKKDLKNQLDIAESKLITINNPITEIKQLPSEKYKYPEIIKFITIGRLSEEKGHERILKGLAKLKNYSYSYTIIGSGPLELKIKDLANELGVLDNIKFIPYTSEVLENLSKSDYFIQGSYVEGFPNAVLESCSVGTPVLAFDCPGGTKEIIEDGINGVLAVTEDDFAKTLHNLNETPIFERTVVRASVLTKFSSQKIIKEYENLFLSVLAC